MTDLAAHTDSTPLGPTHHIPAELLLDYATGTLSEAWSLAAACHLTLCPHCRHELKAVEAMAGSMVEQIVPQPIADQDRAVAGFAGIAGRLGPQESARNARPVADPDGLPQPLRQYLGGGLADVRWRWSGAGLQSFALPMTRQRKAGGMVSLLKVAPGAGLPRHTHTGDEITLVLSGGYTAGDAAFRRGDVEIADPAVEHRPLAMLDQPCICLAITDAPLRFSGALGWFFNQWARFSA
ncbi:ChrR family anti-sigma-E factor [Ferrovibrio terrae]|uniref:ChrR family anti-sigma-E factor n=1 Tax=Ferrovibrio terrae TaxID=2594003 RepID=UPI00163DE20E|nr:ChrR family anti-sigma-E factor [Ferrovibrio terrae]